MGKEGDFKQLEPVFFTNCWDFKNSQPFIKVTENHLEKEKTSFLMLPEDAEK